MGREAAALGAITGVTTAEPALGPPRGLWIDAWRRLIKNRLAMLGLVLLVVLALLAFVGARVGPTGRYEPNEQVYTAGAKHQAPSGEHWFGTDQLGRDMFARVLEGLRVSFRIGLGTQLVVLLIGVLVGAAAALGGRWSDNVFMRFTDIMYAFPDLLAIILVRSVLIGRDWPVVTNQQVIIILAIGLVYWTTIARLVRGQMLSLQERDYVLAARSMGASRGRIVFQHMLPNALGPIIVAITFGIPFAIFAEAALAFVGLGVPSPTVSLGALVSTGYSTIERNVWSVIFPAGAVATLMLCFTFLGDGLRDALDPRTR
jgi:oligopeptide transport system permease protein